MIKSKDTDIIHLLKYSIVAAKGKTDLCLPVRKLDVDGVRKHHRNLTSHIVSPIFWSTQPLRRRKKS